MGQITPFANSSSRCTSSQASAAGRKCIGFARIGMVLFNFSSYRYLGLLTLPISVYRAARNLSKGISPYKNWRRAGSDNPSPNVHFDITVWRRRSVSSSSRPERRPSGCSQSFTLDKLGSSGSTHCGASVAKIGVRASVSHSVPFQCLGWPTCTTIMPGSEGRGVASPAGIPVRGATTYIYLHNFESTN